MGTEIRVLHGYTRSEVVGYRELVTSSIITIIALQIISMTLSQTKEEIMLCWLMMTFLWIALFQKSSSKFNESCLVVAGLH